MSELVTNCPRCGANEHTFDALYVMPDGYDYSGFRKFEAFCRCRRCKKGTIFLVEQSYSDAQGSKICRLEELHNRSLMLNDCVDVKGHVCIRNMSAEEAPEHTPEKISQVFKEGAESVVGGCPNAAVSMFRLCLDLATKSLLPVEETEGLNNYQRGKLKPRLDWLFENGVLPVALQDLSDCIREDGNDGAHDGTLDMNDAKDVMEFCAILLERLYTEPIRLEIAKARREGRRSAS